MGQLNRYIFRRAITAISGLIAFALAVLLLERLLRIFEIVSSSASPGGDAGQMVLNLLPYYLGIAIPMALMLGTIMTIDRISRSSELTSALGAGISLFHITKPFVLIAIVMTGFTMVIEGYLIPIGRYGYREVVHTVKQQSFSAVMREGKFTKVGRRTFYAAANNENKSIGPIFIHENLPSGALRITTAERGDLILREDTGQPVLQLEKGEGFSISKNKNVSGQLSFQTSSVAHTITENRFRRRGEDERELTSGELMKNRSGTFFPKLSKDVNNAALHLRIARAYMLLLIPFFAVPFGINYGRNPSSAGIFVGIISLITIQKALEFGQSMGAKGAIPPWAGIWPLMGVLTIAAFFLYRSSAYKMGQPPLATLSIFLSDIMKDFRKSIQRIMPGTKIKPNKEPSS